MSSKPHYGNLSTWTAFEEIVPERRVRTFETATRNTFDISAIPVVKKLSHLPVVAEIDFAM